MARESTKAIAAGILASGLFAALVLSSIPGLLASASPQHPPPAKWILGPIYATGCPVWARCGEGEDMASEATADLDHAAAFDIPVTVYHFDGDGWSSGSCTWALGDQLIERLHAGGVRAMVHAWGGCDRAEQIDRLHDKLGATLGAVYLDERSTDAFAGAAFELIRSLAPGDGEVVMKAYQADGRETDAGLATYGHAAYVSDLNGDFAGLRTGIARVFDKRHLLAAPFNEFTGYDGRNQLGEEVYFRRLHWGALQMVMEHDCVFDCDPWGSRYAAYSPALLSAYRYYAWLHRELVPYLHSYDYQMYETGLPVFRDSDPARYTTKLGEELFVAYVTQPGVSTLDITLPGGEWVNLRDAGNLYQGPATISYPVPWGREPIFVRNGSLIPLEVSRDYTGHGTPASAGSLTVLVYPKGKSSFLYRDQESWVKIGAELDGNQLTLSVSPPPSQPLIYRIERWDAPPDSVAVLGTTIQVNQGGSRTRPLHVTSEDAANGARSNAWFYDRSAKRLIVKLVRATTDQEIRPRAVERPRDPFPRPPFRLLPGRPY